MAKWGNILSRGLVQDRRGAPLPVQYTRPLVMNQVPNINSVPNVGIPFRYRNPAMIGPGEQIGGILNTEEMPLPIKAPGKRVTIR